MRHRVSREGELTQTTTLFAFRRAATTTGFGARAFEHHRRCIASARGGGVAHRRAITTTSTAKKPKMAHEDDGQQLRVKKLSDVAVLPVRGSQGAAGYDLARYDAGRDDEDEAGEDDEATGDDDVDAIFKISNETDVIVYKQCVRLRRTRGW